MASSAAVSPAFDSGLRWLPQHCSRRLYSRCKMLHAGCSVLSGCFFGSSSLKAELRRVSSLPPGEVGGSSS
ncbi:hypothetical protein F2Q70_00015601 [Brassica cretica]|uniref:Uncharacterized protein n=1 Tax=Brassica cretica TaxID=69181 RepID=A0A8S9KZ08_BRACR|nr:hypothetical protein F2Q70_00015601 [Brassica cretica]KAF2598957.1 hypothetical protein F2Q68_00008545 [Brassica cretica]